RLMLPKASARASVCPGHGMASVMRRWGRRRAAAAGLALLAALLQAHCFTGLQCKSRGSLACRSATADELEALKVVDLKEMCREKGLAVSGTKAQLISRILEEEDEAEEAEEEEEEEAVAAAPAPPPPPSRKRSPSGYVEETDISGPKGRPVISGDTVYLLARTGKYLEYPEHREDPRARAAIKSTRQALAIQKNGGGAIQSGDTIALKCHLGVYLDFKGTAVRARQSQAGEWQEIRITSEAGGPIRTGDVVFLRGHEGNVLDVEKEDVKCRWPGPWGLLLPARRGQVAALGDREVSEL
ncbi:unnamed protein product, partial [Effrenium voratum]